ncbi:MAG: hypothetical protein K2G73_01090 [Eubacterium sp.]|nr:hypothetical protein [Eubacterium sp.]
MKKIISVFISICIVATVFAGCTKDKTDEQADNLPITFDSHYANYDASAMSAYENLCNAVIKGEEEVKYNIRMLDSVNQLYYTGFPLNALVESIDIMPDSSGVKITYKNDIETHLELVAEFNARVNEILEACGYGSVNSSRFVFNVYDYIIKNFKVDNSVVNTYDVILQGKGIKSAVNSVFEYLVLCGGGKASHAVSYDNTPDMISLVNFNNDWYYFDPASEIENNSGKALKYFGMNDKRIAAYISGQLEYTDGMPVGTVTDDKYGKLENSSSYEAKNDEISVVLSNDEIIVLDLN